jgi:hypothetical protein
MADSDLPHADIGIVPLRDSCIRVPLGQWLIAEHSDQADTKVFQEVKIPRPSARADVVVVNGEFCGFEIKSDVDSLRRLPKQAVAFSAVFDRVCIVTTPTHLKTARKSIPKWWGIIVPSFSSGQRFTSLRKPRKNPNIDTVALLHMLLRRELINIVNSKSLAHDLVKLKRPELIAALHKQLPAQEIKNEVRRLFKLRKVPAGHSSSSAP